MPADSETSAGIPPQGSEILIQNPYHNYAERFIDVFYRRYGVRAVCFYTDEAEYHLMRAQAPAIDDPRVSASYFVDETELDSFAAVLRRDHHIAAALPYYEQAVGPASRLADLLDLDWAQPEVLQRFRDKYAMKQYLRTVPDGPRINAIASVRTIDDIQAAITTGQFSRFVLKPNNGGGNVNIGFFDDTVDTATLAEYLSDGESDEFLMEEFIAGEEYFVNGQVDGDGSVAIFDISRYDRREINGRINVEFGCVSIRTHETEFDLCRHYAEAVVTATGLRRSPFHLELKIDDRGACLIEVAARLAGTDLAIDDNLMHGTLDSLAIAAHYYLTADSYGDLGLNWQLYDSRVYGQLSGPSSALGRIYEIGGIAEVETAPGFVRWVEAPRIGDRQVPTVGVFEYLWIASVEADTAQQFQELGDWMRRTVTVNSTSSGVARWGRRALGALPVAKRVAEREFARRSRRQPVRVEPATPAINSVADALRQSLATGTPPAEVLIQNPYNVYAVRFIELLASRYGLRTVCLYTDAAEMRQQCWQFPQLRGPHVSASYVAEDASLEQVGRELGQRHRICAVIPHTEGIVVDAELLAESLGLNWAQPDVRWRFRDKFALKDYLRSQPDGPRINAITQVASVDEITAAIASGQFPSFVLKPNDGAGNTNIGFFRADDDPATLAEYLGHSTPGVPVLMEEFIGGEEYYVDGQIDAVGTVTIVGIYHYVRYEVNGRRNVLSGTESLASTSENFITLADYATQVLGASGLRRSPFHLEAKIDDGGPCLIEVAARFVGADGVDVDNVLHGHLDVFDLAAHYCLTETDYGPTGVDWKYADRQVRGQVFGASTVAGRVTAIAGMAEVEAHPGFLQWAKAPRIGDRVFPTVDVMQHPWIATVEADSHEAMSELRTWMHRTLVLSCDTSGVRSRVAQARAALPVIDRLARRRFTPLPRAETVAMPE